MTNKRRERDRPKAAHDSLYNPNKRVLLSYDSDDDDEYEPAIDLSDDGLPGTEIDLSTGFVNKSVVEDGDEVDSIGDSAPEPESGDLKDQPSGDQLEEDGSDNVLNEKPLYKRQAHRNEATGQWPALGSLAYEWEDGEEEEEYESSEEEAMAYLRSVRSERQDMPAVIKAPNTYTDEEIYASGIGDTRGFYDDGAYVARASLGPQLPESAKIVVLPREAFTAALKQRFTSLNRQMHLPPTAMALTNLDDSKHPISFPPNSNKAWADWTRIIRTKAPLPAQVQSMDQRTVFGLLRLLRKHYVKRERLITRNISTWLWCLLARLDDVGTMQNDDVWELRELGKQAVLVQLSFRDSDAAVHLEQAGEAEAGIAEENGEDEGSMAKTPTQNGHSELSPSYQAHESGAEDMRNTHATLDMILVLVGEIFGQRDLLEFRQPWEGEVDDAS